MGFLRRWLGGTREEGDPGTTDPAASPRRDPAIGAGPPTGEPDPTAGPGEGTDAGSIPGSDDELERERALAREFDQGLSDLARRQIRFAALAWTPPSERRRDGDWILMQPTQVQSPGGKDVKLGAGSRLTWVGPGSLSPGAVRFTTESGLLVELPAGRETDDGWPDDLQRPRSTSAGADD
jgi:hypothetical protein